MFLKKFSKNFPDFRKEHSCDERVKCLLFLVGNVIMYSAYFRHIQRKNTVSFGSNLLKNVLKMMPER